VGEREPQGLSSEKTPRGELESSKHCFFQAVCANFETFFSDMALLVPFLRGPTQLSHAWSLLPLKQAVRRPGLSGFSSSQIISRVEPDLVLLLMRDA